MVLDNFDLKILRVLQQQGNCSMSDLGEQVGLSHTPCWRRVRRLEEAGVIRERVALLDPAALGLSVTVYAYINIKRHDEDSLNDFENAVKQIDNVVECHSTSGDKDYVLRVVVKNVEHYERLLKTTLVHLPNVAAVHSTFALKCVKHTTRLPI